jgi:hypothetical protein
MTCLVLGALLSVAPAAVSQGDEIATQAAALSKKLSVKVVYDRVVPDTWNIGKYRVPADRARLKHYLGLLDAEYSKYPAGFLVKAQAGTLILCEAFVINGTPCAAMPDPYGNRLYLAIDGAYGTGTDSYLVHVMHHELNHNTEYAIWKNQYYKWNEWAALNTPGFTYGQGGASAYGIINVDYYSFTNPAPGFLNLYSMTAQEEDRSEIIALMMSDLERPSLVALCEKDAILRAKVKKLVSLMDGFAGTPAGTAYWNKNNADCCR